MDALDFSGKRVLITGGAGFIAANLARRLLALGAEVFVTTRPSSDVWRLKGIRDELRFMVQDIDDREGLRDRLLSLAPQVIFHTAVQRDERNRHSLLHTNLLSAIELMRSVDSRVLKRFVMFGSSTEYGPLESPLRENALAKPDTFYGATKLAATNFALQAAAGEGFPAVVLRPFYVYGPYDASKRFIPKVIDAIRKGREIQLTPSGYTHDFVYIDDVVDICLRAALVDRAIGRIYNVGSSVQTSNETVVRELASILGMPADVQIGAYPLRKYDSKDRVADISLAEADLGWRPRHELRRGLEKTVEWVVSRHDEFDCG